MFKKYRVAVPASLCVSVEADSVEEAKVEAKLVAAQYDTAQIYPVNDVVLYVDEEAEAVVEDTW